MPAQKARWVAVNGKHVFVKNDGTIANGPTNFMGKPLDAKRIKEISDSARATLRETQSTLEQSEALKSFDDTAVQYDQIAEKGWVTIKGTHVFIGADGKITKGPAWAIGKTFEQHLAGSTLSTVQTVKNSKLLGEGFKVAVNDSNVVTHGPTGTVGLKNKSPQFDAALKNVTAKISDVKTIKSGNVYPNGYQVALDENKTVLVGPKGTVGTKYETNAFYEGLKTGASATAAPSTPSPSYKPASPTASVMSSTAAMEAAVNAHPTISLNDLTTHQKAYIAQVVSSTSASSNDVKVAVAKSALAQMLATKYTKGASSVAEIAQKVAAKNPAPVAPTLPPPETFKTVKGWEQTGPQLGSNSGGVYKDENDDAHYVKFYSTESQAKNEKLANDIYRALGVNAPSSKLVSIDGKSAIASKMLAGASPMSTSDMASHDGVRKGFVADAFLANHDVVGLANDNIIKDALGGAVRIDNGGTMFYRAQGGAKSGFDASVKELDTMRNPAIAHEAGHVFQGLTDDDLKPQAEAVVNTLTPAKIASLVSGAGFTGTEAAKYVKTLIDRRTDIAQRFGIKTSAPLESKRFEKMHEQFLNAWNGGSTSPRASLVHAAQNRSDGLSSTDGMHQTLLAQYESAVNKIDKIDPAFQVDVDSYVAMQSAKYAGMTLSTSNLTQVRGVRDGYAKLLAQASIGDTITTNPLQSTTKTSNMSVAKSFAGSDGAIIHFEGLTGDEIFASKTIPHKDGTDDVGLTGEHETIVKGGSSRKWAITSIDKAGVVDALPHYHVRIKKD